MMLALKLQPVVDCACVSAMVAEEMRSVAVMLMVKARNMIRPPNVRLAGNAI
jgi:hypothetical protein